MFKKKNKKGMLGNLVGGFIVIIIGVTMIGTISQEIDNVLNCHTNFTNMTNVSNYQVPIGSTDSFGGGGGQFGGYDGKVHKSWTSNLAPIKTNSTFTGVCLAEDSPNRIVLKFVPIFFIVAIILTGLYAVYNGLMDAGFLNLNSDSY